MGCKCCSMDVTELRLGLKTADAEASNPLRLHPCSAQSCPFKTSLQFLTPRNLCPICYIILHHIYCHCGGRNFSTAMVGNPCERGNEIALASFILQAEPRAESRQTWGASTSPPAFSYLSGVTDSVGVHWSSGEGDIMA